MKRFFTLLLSLTLLLSAGSALGAERSPFPPVRDYEGFSDVAEGAWYADAVKLCYETGLFSGTGNGKFSPEKKLTNGEAEALAARLHAAISGTGAVPKAPDGTGSFLLTLPDGKTAVTAYGCGPAAALFGPHDFAVFLSLETCNALGAPETLSALVDGTHTVVGHRLPPDREDNAGGVTYDFSVSDAVFTLCDPAARLFGNQSSRLKDAPDRQLGAWFWDGDRYLKGLPGSAKALFEAKLEAPCHRGGFASLLDLVCPPAVIPAINHITALPDTGRADVLRLYNGGILTGMDAYGSFRCDNTLTRAEAATMLARILRPELRKTTTLTHDGLPYSLKELPLSQAYGGSYFVFPCPLPEGTSPLLLAAPDLGGRIGPNGLMDWAGNWVVPPTYDHIDNFRADGVARVKAGNFYGFISTSGKVILPPKYPYATQFHDGVLVVGDENGPFTAYDTTGKKLGTLPSNCNYNNTSGGFIQYRDGEKYGYLNADGSVALKAAYDKVYPVSMGYAPVGIGRQRGFVDLKGNVTVPLIYDLIASGFGPEGYAVVGRGNTQPSPLHYDGKLGMVDTAGKEVIPFLYDNLEPFADGKAPFVRGHVTGYLTPEGREVPDPQNPTEPQNPDPLAAWLHLTRPHGYELITEIQDGKAVVLLGGRYYLLTLTQ